MIFLELIKLLTCTWLSRTRCVLMSHALRSVSASLAARGSHTVLRSVLLEAEDLGLDSLVASVVLTRSILGGVLLSHWKSMGSLGRAGMCCWACCGQWSVTSSGLDTLISENGRIDHTWTTCSYSSWWLWNNIWVNRNVTVWSYGGV